MINYKYNAHFWAVSKFKNLLKNLKTFCKDNKQLKNYAENLRKP